MLKDDELDNIFCNMFFIFIFIFFCYQFFYWLFFFEEIMEFDFFIVWRVISFVGYEEIVEFMVKFYMQVVFNKCFF